MSRGRGTTWGRRRRDGTAAAQQQLADLLLAAHPMRDGEVEDCAEAFRVVLNRGVGLEDGRPGASA
ncbi:hypothetical protein GCM10010518_24660 [Kitasatospora cinereorecta]